jgi:hypothetical protein
MSDLRRSVIGEIREESLAEIELLQKHLSAGCKRLRLLIKSVRTMDLAQRRLAKWRNQLAVETQPED